MMTYAEVRAEADRRGPLLPTAPPTARDVNVGWSLWEVAPADSDYPVRGGLVAHVVTGGAVVPDTGEVVDRYVLVRVEVDANRGRLVWLSLRADQVAPVTDSSRPNATTIRGVCQVAAREAAKCRRDERLLELFSLGTRLMAVVARPSSVPVP